MGTLTTLNYNIYNIDTHYKIQYMEIMFIICERSDKICV